MAVLLFLRKVGFGISNSCSPITKKGRLVVELLLVRRTVLSKSCSCTPITKKGRLVVVFLLLRKVGW